MNLDFYSACQNIDGGQLPVSVFDKVLAGSISSKYKRRYELLDHQKLLMTCDQVLSVLKKYDCKVTKIYLSCGGLVVPIFNRTDSFIGSIANEDIQIFSQDFSLPNHRFGFDLIGEMSFLFDKSVEYMMITSPGRILPLGLSLGNSIIDCTWRVEEICV